MALMEPPITDFMLSVSSESRSETEVRAIINGLLDKTQEQVMQQLLDRGFTTQDIQRMDRWIDAVLDETSLAEILARPLHSVKDIGDEDELKATLNQWMEDIQWRTALMQIQGLDCPDEALALGYAVRHLRRVADNTIWFESNRRTTAQETEPDREMTRDEIREGIELAETGLALDASEWPKY